MLKNDTEETLALHTCETVDELDSKMEKIEAKLEAAYAEFCAKVDILSTLTAMLPSLNNILENNPGSGKEIEGLIGEVISGIDGSLSSSSSAKDVKEINKQSKEKIEELTNGDIQKKIKEIEEKMEKEGKQEEKPKNFFALNELA